MSIITIVGERIKEIISEWRNDIRRLPGTKEIIAISFGVQKVREGYELLLSGHTWYDGQDLWLLDAQWSPERNHLSLGVESLIIDRPAMLAAYETLLKQEIAGSKALYQDLIVTLGFTDGDFIRLH